VGREGRDAIERKGKNTLCYSFSQNRRQEVSQYIYFSTRRGRKGRTFPTPVEEREDKSLKLIYRASHRDKLRSCLSQLPIKEGEGEKKGEDGPLSCKTLTWGRKGRELAKSLPLKPGVLRLPILIEGKGGGEGRYALLLIPSE